MGCRIPLTGTDMRHHPGENFEKPFVSWLKTLWSSIFSRRMGGVLSRRARPRGGPQHAVPGPRQRGQAGTLACQARTLRVRPARCGSDPPGRMSAGTPPTATTAGRRATGPCAGRCRLRASPARARPSRPSGGRTSPSPPRASRLQRGRLSAGLGCSRSSGSATGGCRRRAVPRAPDPCGRSSHAGARSAGARRSAGERRREAVRRAP